MIYVLGTTVFLKKLRFEFYLLLYNFCLPNCLTLTNKLTHFQDLQNLLYCLVERVRGRNRNALASD